MLLPPGGEASEKELRAQLRSVQLERDALLKDVEALCMQVSVAHQNCLPSGMHLR